MTQTITETNGTIRLRNVLGLLEQLRKYPVGSVIYDQVARLVDEHRHVQSKVDQAYTQLLHVLLEAYARSPDAESVVRINARLIDLRQSLVGGVGLRETVAARAQPGSEEATAGTEAPAAVGAASVLEQLLRGLDSAVPAAKKPDQPEKPVVRPEHAERPAPSEAAPSPPSVPAPGEEQTPLIERRVNSAYRLHLDRKRDEIEKLQEALAQNVNAAIAQNREFGALLEIELRALQQADGAQEIETLRQILIGGIEELLQGQRSLDARLHQTGDYLRLIKTDSQRLRDELTKVRLLSLTDESTGLPNRRAFMRRLQDEISRSQRYGTPLAMALIDLDEFKAINDAYGHIAGDEVLRCYAAHVLTILRHHDMVARYGGEEFAVLLPNTEQDGAIAAINKIRSRAKEICCEYESKSLPIPTFSTGLTMYVAGESHASLIDRADRALYRAKHLGRNRIEVELGHSIVEPPPESTETRQS